jgi:hypothetical protein
MYRAATCPQITGQTYRNSVRECEHLPRCAWVARCARGARIPRSGIRAPTCPSPAARRYVVDCQVGSIDMVERKRERGCEDSASRNPSTLAPTDGNTIRFANSYTYTRHRLVTVPYLLRNPEFPTSTPITQSVTLGDFLSATPITLSVCVCVCGGVLYQHIPLRDINFFP